MKKTILTMMLAIIMWNCYSQFSCNIDGERNSLIRSMETNKYIPDEYTPIKYIKLNFHFMLKSDSTLNFRPFDDGLGDCSFTAYDYSDEIIRKMNQRLSSNSPMHLPQGNNTEVLDRQYRVLLKGVYFHYDDNAYTFSNTSPGFLSIPEIQSYSVNADEEVNVFFVYEDNPNENDGGNANMDGNRYIRKKKSWQKYVGYGSVGFWADAFVLVHELGHNLGLYHTMHYSWGGCCDICDDGFSDTPTRIEIINSGQPDPCPSFGDEGASFSNNMMDYSGLLAVTPEQLGMVHYTLTHGMFSYLEDDFCSINYSEPQVVLESGHDLTWQNDRILKNNLVIESGAKLTIKNCIIHIPNGAGIIVKPGGKLFVDGAIITNRCGAMWQGIEVWGSSNSPQYEVNGSYLQGYLEMKNGAVIENAVCAVELWRPGHYSTTGGIIHATDATFRNNAKAVHALYYTYPSGGTSDYNAYFRNCTFKVDENYPGTEVFSKHVDLSHVNGFDFNGCTFSAKRSVTGVSQYCIGIGAYNAGFLVNSNCDYPSGVQPDPCPEDDVVRSSFTGFYKGIHASVADQTGYGFRVEDAVFSDNNFGLYTLNTNYGTVLNNDFTVGCSSDCDFGIYAEGATGFCFEDNTFQPKTANTGSPYGIVIVNSKGINDVYHNSFANLRCGNVAVGENRCGHSPNSLAVPGLTYSCNTNTGNLVDFCVLKDGNTGGIASPQGSLTLPAGNTFGGDQYHFYNDGDQVIGYYFNSNESSQTPVSTLLYRVGAYGVQSTNNCQSHYSGGSAIKSAAEKAELASQYLTARSTYNSLKQLYESRIDGGSTPAQVSDISSATPSDIWRLRAQLLGISPYVSGEVLVSAADRDDVFTDPVLFEILAANPDELKKDSLISYLENKQHPMPTYMTDLLRQIASGATARTALLSQMGQYHHAYSLAAGDIVRSCLNDSLTDLAELRTWLGNMDDIASDRMIVASYLQEGDSASAFALAEMLPELYSLQGEALADHEAYMDLMGLHQTLKREGRTVLELTDTELAMVNGIASSGSGTSKAMAEAMLAERSEENTLSHYCPTMPEDDGGNRGRTSFDGNAMNKAMGFTVNVIPNPASTWAMVDYALPSDKSQAVFTLTNTFGIAVMSTELNGRQGQKVLDLRNLADGVYVYTIRSGEYSITGKLVVTK